MSRDDIEEMLITSILLLIFLHMLAGCSSIDIVHRPNNTPKVEIKSEFLDALCSKDFDADIKTDQFLITCEVAL